MLRWFVLQWQFHLSEPYTNDIALLNRHSQSLAATLRKVQNGFVRSYALSILLGVVFILGYLIFK